jgi:antitoxin component of MazEF toxin-antitoxin module
MIKTLTRTGNSLALVLDKALLEATGIDADTLLEVSTNGDVILVSPVRSRKRTARLKRIMAELDEAHAGAFRRLAQ